MHRARRCLLPAVAVCTLIAPWFISSPAGAAPLPAVTISGAAIASSDRVTFTYTVGVPTGSAVDVGFATHQDALLPATAASVTSFAVDRRTPATAPTLAAGNLSTDLGTLAAGRHTVSFTTPITVTTPASTSSSATITADAVDTASPAVVVEVNRPDLELTYSDPEDSASDPSYVGVGAEDEEDYAVSNVGSSAVDAELVLSLPAGIELDGVEVGPDGADGDCTTEAPSGDTVCALGSIAPGTDPQEVEVDLVGTAAAAPGSRAHYQAAVRTAAGEPVDANQANNSVGYDVIFTGIAALSVTAKADATRVTVGGSTRVTVTVHNRGPQPALYTIGLVSVTGDDPSTLTDPVVSITATDGPETPGSGYPGDISGVLAAHRRLAPHVLTGRATPHETGLESELRFWFPGSIPAGGTVTAHYIVKADRVGTAPFSVLAFSAAGNPACPDDLSSDSDAIPSCLGAETTLTVTKAVPVVSPTPTSTSPSSPSGSGSALANTGSPSAPLTALGIGLLLAGAGLLRLGRRRSAGLHQ